MKHLLYFVVIAATMLLMARGLPGFHVDGWGAALVAALVLAVVNTIVKPILFLLTLPFTIVTLGLFLFVLNAACLWLTSVLVPGFDVTNFLAALVASIVLSLVGMTWKSLTRGSRRDREERGA